MKLVAREQVKIVKGMPEAYSTKTLINAFIKHTAASRKEMYSAQMLSMTIPRRAETPKSDSSLGPAILTKSSCVQVLRDTKIKILGRFKYDLDTTVFYEHEGVIKMLDFHPYDYSRDWGVANISDLINEDIPLNEEIEIGEYPFRIEAIDSYNPSTDTVGYGRNLRVITSIDRKNEEDGTYISDKVLKDFTCIKRRVIELKIDDVFVKGFGNSIFPKVGDIIKSDKLVTLVKASKYKTISSIGEATMEDDTLVLAPGSFISRLDVISNVPIQNEELEGYRLKRLNHRREIYEFLKRLDSSRFDSMVSRVMDDYKYETFRDREIDYDRPMIRISLCRVDVPGVGSKYTTTAGGKFTVDGIFRHGDYLDDRGEPIDLILSASSIVKRENYSTPYFEKHINAINLHLHRCVKEGRLSPEKLYDIVRSIYTIAGEDQLRCFDRMCLTYDELFQLYASDVPKYIDMPESCVSDINMFANIQRVLINHGVPREDSIIKFKGIPLTSKHEVGIIFVIKLLNDVEFGAQMSGLVEVDTRGYPLDNSNTRLTGRSYWNVKPGKFSDLALNLLVNLLKNEYVHVLLNEVDNFSMNEYMNAIGAEFMLTSNRDMSALSGDDLVDEDYDEYDEYIESNDEVDDYDYDDE